MGDLETLQKEYAAQREENAALRKQVAQLIAEVARLTDRVVELVAVAQRKHRKPAPDKPPVPPPTVDASARRAFDERPAAPAKPVAVPTPKAPTKPAGRNPVPAHLAAEEHELRPDACADCGATAGLDVVDRLVEEKLHVVKEHQRRRVVVRFTCRCRRCGTRTTPRSLPAPYDRSKIVTVRPIAFLTPPTRSHRSSRWRRECGRREQLGKSESSDGGIADYRRPSIRASSGSAPGL